MNSPAARIGGMDVSSPDQFSKVRGMRLPARRGLAYQHILDSLEQGVEPALWNALEEKAMQPNLQQQDRDAIPLAIEALKKNQTTVRLTDYQARMRREDIVRTLDAVHDHARGWLETCLAGIHVLDAVELKILPEEIVGNHDAASRRLVLESVFRFDKNTVRPAPGFDGVTVSSNQPHDAPLHPDRWERAHYVLSSIGLTLEAEGLMQETAMKELSAITQDIRSDMKKRVGEFRAARDAKTERGFFDWLRTLRGQAVPEPKTASDVEAETRAEFQRRAEQWVWTLREGFRLNRLKGFLR